jgi:hypothetical protein
MNVVFFTSSHAQTPISGSIPVPEVSSNSIDDHSPGFDDRCIFDIFTWSSTAIHRDLRYATGSDLFTDSEDHIVRLAVDRGWKYLIVSGMKCNLWVPSLFEKLKKSGIAPIWVSDLSDVAFYRPSQLTHFTTHRDAAISFEKWLLNQSFSIGNHWDLLDQDPPRSAKAVKFDGNMNAFLFDWYF